MSRPAVQQRTLNVESEDVSIFVRERGEPGRPIVVLIHGYPDTSAVWGQVADLLAESYLVISYDVRGAGATSSPQDNDGYRMEHLLADLRAVLDVTAPGARVHLVGHDWGSIQGWEAVTEPVLNGRFASYTSIYAPSLDHAGYWVWQRLRHPSLRGLRQLASQGARSWYVLAFHLPGAKWAWRGVVGRWFPVIQRRVDGVGPLPDYPASTLRDDAARGVELYRSNFGERIRHPRPRVTEIPVQVILPEDDHYVTPALAEGLERWVPKLSTRKVKGGHWLPVTRPGPVATWIGELVDQVEGTEHAAERLTT